MLTKGQILVFPSSPRKQMNEFFFSTTNNSFVCFLGEFEDTKKSFQNYLTIKCDVRLWNEVLTIDSNATQQEWMNFAFIYFSSSILSFGQCDLPYCQIKTSIEKSIAVFNSTASKVFSFFLSYSISQRSRAHNNIECVVC